VKSSRRKRANSEDASSATSTSAIVAAVKKSSRLASGGGRKRTKTKHYDDSSSSSSSEAPDPPPDLVDQSILTLGSRVLVTYKGSLFKATIRKRRFKNDVHGFLIHYDGNKRTNVHWVDLGRIKKILEINVDTPPKRKRAEREKQRRLLVEPQATADTKGLAGRDRKKKARTPPPPLPENDAGDDHPEKEAAGHRRESTADDTDEEDTKDKNKREVGVREEMPAKETTESCVDLEKQPQHSEDASDSALSPPVKARHTEEDDAAKSSNILTVSATAKENEQDKKDENPMLITSMSEDTTEAVDLKVGSNGECVLSTKKECSSRSEDTAEAAEMKVGLNNACVLSKKKEYSSRSEETAEAAERKVGSNHEHVLSKEKTCSVENNQEALSTKTEKPKAFVDGSDRNSDTRREEFLPASGLAVSLSSPDQPAHKAKEKSDCISDTTAVKQPCKEPSEEKKDTTATNTSISNNSPRDTLAAAKSDLKDPLQILTEDPKNDVADEEGNSDEDTDDENNSTSTSSSAKQQESAPSSGESTSEMKFAKGGHVYVEYRQILYSCTILKTRRKRGATEYLVHYAGYKKSSNRWVKESALHQVNVKTTKRFEDQRLDVLYESTPLQKFSMTTRGKKMTEEKVRVERSPPLNDGAHQSAATQKKAHSRKMRLDNSELRSQSTLLESIDSGVSFLAGSMVFVEWREALYLAKMIKKRYFGKRMEYLISYDGFDSNHDGWVSIHKIYEVNPQTKRVFAKINSEIIREGPTTIEEKHPAKQRRRVAAAPAPAVKPRETRKRAKETAAAVVTASSNSEDNPPTSTTQNGRLRNNDKPFGRQSSSSSNTRSGGASSSLRHVQRSIPTIQQPTIDMQGIDPGVEFLPGSTLFAEYEGSLCLAKMLKKRGKGDCMEYLLQYKLEKKKTEMEDEGKNEPECWVPTNMVYEINPQTKRMFRQFLKNKK